MSFHVCYCYCGITDAQIHQHLYEMLKASWIAYTAGLWKSPPHIFTSKAQETDLSHSESTSYRGKYITCCASQRASLERKPYWEVKTLLLVAHATIHVYTP